MIIGIGYKARSGKDTVAKRLIEDYDFTPYRFAGPLKRAAIHAYGLTYDQVHGDEKLVVDPYWGKAPVEILQFLGTDVFRKHVSEDHWVKLARRILAGSEYDWVIPDVRFNNEANAIKDMGGILIRVDRDDRGETGRDNVHASEMELDGYAGWDYVLNNNGTLDDLHEGVDTIMIHLGI